MNTLLYGNFLEMKSLKYENIPAINTLKYGNFLARNKFKFRN